MFDPINLVLPGTIYLLLLLLLLAGCACLSQCRLPLRPIRKPLVALFLWGWIFATPGLANLAVMSLEGQAAGVQEPTLQRADAPLIVVLASGELFSRNGQTGARLDASGWERLRAGIQLRSRIGGTLLFAGGLGSDPDQSLSGLMRNVAIESGVPPGSIMISHRSRTTHEDLLQTREQVLNHIGTAWLVTSALHMPRALAVARKLGSTLLPHPCDFKQIENPTWRIWVPDNGAPALWAGVLHEIIGRQYYRLRGWSD